MSRMIFRVSVLLSDKFRSNLLYEKRVNDGRNQEFLETKIVQVKNCENSKLTIGFDANKERDVKFEIRETVA